MQTILTEKKSAYDNFVKALGGETGNLNGSPYKIVHARGHLFEYKPLGEMVPKEIEKQFTDYSIENLPFDRSQIHFELQLKQRTVNGKTTADQGVVQLFQNIKQSFDASDTVIIATDTDPSGEGDLLAWEIINNAHFQGSVLRCNFTDESVKELRRALESQNLRPVTYNDPLVLSALARQQFDFYTIQYSRLTSGLARNQQVLPARSFVREGRLKSAMTALIGQREMDHDTFKPRSDYELAYLDTYGHAFRQSKAERFPTPVLALASNQNKYPDLSNVKKLKEEEKIVEPPRLYDMMTLSGVISQMGYDTASFNSTYQAMYEAQYLSYPRTEDKLITEEQLEDAKVLLPDLCRLLDIDQALVNPNNFARKNLYKTGDKGAAPSHGANRPGNKLPSSLSFLGNYGELGPVIYEVLARQLLASFADKKLNKVTTYSDESSDFIYRVTDMLKPGWSLLISKDAQIDSEDDESEDKEDNHKHPDIGGELKIGTKEVKATRPSLFTELSLGKMLAKLELGTGASRKSTFDSCLNIIKERKLFKKTGTQLRLTTLGQISFVLLQKSSLGNPKFTLQLNKFLDGIRSGKGGPVEAGKLFDQMFGKDLPLIKQNIVNLSTFKKVEKKGYDHVEGTFEGKPIKFRGGVFDHKFEEEEITKLLAGETIEVNVTSPKSKTALIAVGKLVEDEKYGWGFKILESKFPPRSTHTGVYEPTGEEITFVNEFQNHKFDSLDCEKLLKGENIAVSVYSKKNKKTFSMEGHLELAYPYGTTASDGVSKEWQFKLVTSAAVERHTQRYMPENVDVTINKTFMGHEFTPEEYNTLYTGGHVSFDGTSKAGKTMKVTVEISYGKNFNKPGKSWQLSLYNDPKTFVEILPPGERKKVKVRRIVFGHELTDSEIASLEADETISFDGTKKDGGTFKAKVKMIYGVPFGQSSKSWHIGFAPRN